ncbi:MAG: hypothetical protein E6786_08735, partial [Finegoldia magna]|nr:hypothetical protein [Finegoldia magna]
MIKRFVDSEFLDEQQAEFIEKAIENHENIIISGHRSTGIRQLLAIMMGIAKKQFKSVQVKGLESMDEDAEYYLIPGIDTEEFEDIV